MAIDFSNPKYKIQPGAQPQGSQTQPSKPLGSITPMGAPKPKIDFSKYKIGASAPVAPKPKQTVAQMFGGAAKNFSTGVAKGELSTVQGLGQGVLAATDALGLTKNKSGSTFFKDPNALKAEGAAQDVGKFAEGAAEALVPIGGAEVKGASIASKVAKPVGSFLKKAAIGKEGIKTLEQIGNKEAQNFASGAKKFGSVVEDTHKAINTFVENSKSALKKVKDSIPDIKVGADKITQAVNDGIMKSVQNTADYKGIKGSAESLFKSPEDLINSGLLNEEEAGKVKGMVKVIKSWGDNSARGVLNLKEQLAPFYKDGLNGSNAILRNIQNGLKDVVGEVAPKVKPALETASKNIEKSEEFSKNLIGRDLITGESKLSSIAKSLKNPAANSEKLKLLEELKQATGHDALPQIKGYADYLELLAKDFPSKVGTIAKSVATGPAAKTAGAVAGLGLVKEGLQNLGL